MYRASSLLRIVSMGLRFTLLMTETITLWHREGMSSSFGASVRWRTFVARVGVEVLSGCGHGSWSAGVWGVRGVS